MHLPNIIKIDPKSILTILSYTVSKFGHFLRHSVAYSTYRALKSREISRENISFSLTCGTSRDKRMYLGVTTDIKEPLAKQSN